MCWRGIRTIPPFALRNPQSGKTQFSLKKTAQNQLSTKKHPALSNCQFFCFESACNESNNNMCVPNCLNLRRAITNSRQGLHCFFSESWSVWLCLGTFGVGSKASLDLICCIARYFSIWLNKISLRYAEGYWGVWTNWIFGDIQGSVGNRHSRDIGIYGFGNGLTRLTSNGLVNYTT